MALATTVCCTPGPQLTVLGSVRRFIGGDKVRGVWGKPSAYTEGTAFLGTPADHLKVSVQHVSHGQGVPVCLRHAWRRSILPIMRCSADGCVCRRLHAQPCGHMHSSRTRMHQPVHTPCHAWHTRHRAHPAHGSALQRTHERPLSPDVLEIDNKSQHYKFPLGALSSITNRVTGVALSVGERACTGRAGAGAGRGDRCRSPAWQESNSNNHSIP